MNTHLKHHSLRLLFICSAILAMTILGAYAQGTAFTYQGRLNDGANPANGTYDLQFALFDAASGGTQQSGTWTQLTQGVTNGLFTVTLDFGSFFPGADRWLEIGVRTNGGSSFTTLAPRQKFTATPYAITAGNLSGSINAAQLPAGVVTNGASGVTLTGSFTGNGANVTNVNAATLGGLTASGFWRASGNAGTIAGTHFLGTTDNQPLEFKVNSVRAMRFEPAVSSVVSFISAPNVLGGWAGNQVVNGAVGATIWGGGFDINTDFRNIVGADFGTVSGGRQNAAGGAEATVAGGRANAANGGNATIGGGYANSASGNYATIGGGQGNAARGESATVIGGQYNNNEGALATIGGGYNNRIHTNAVAAMIAGGHENIIQSNASYSMIGSGGYHVIGTNSYDSIIGGGGYNTIQNDAQGTVIAGGSVNLIGTGSFWAAIGGGEYNTNKSPWATIAGGYQNNIETNGTGSFIAGGYNNTIASDAFAASIGGGRGNWIQTGAFDSTIGGGPYNFIQTNANAATIGGGYINIIGPSAGASTIAGGVGNSVQSNAIGSAVSGGYFNGIQPNASVSFIGGGTNNSIAAPRSVVGGGEGNSAQGEYSAIGGGGFNQATGRSAFVGGGGGRDAAGGGPYGNTASGDWSTIGGGWLQVSSGYSSTVGGGALNQATNTYATIPGGFLNVAGGHLSLAAGQQAHALHQGSFVWGDSQDAVFSSTANNQFLVRSVGGVGINKNNPTTALDVNGTVTASGFSGPGGSLVGLNASQITSGTLPDARLSANIATLNGAQTFTGAKTFSAPSTFNNFVGIGTSSAIGAGSLIVSANTSGFAGMYVNSGANGQPFYGYAQNGIATAWSYVDGTDANKWKLYGPGADVSLTVTTAGNIGIGTTSPTSKLHVLGGATFTSGSGGANQTVSWTPGSASWSFTSDRNTKSRVAPVDTQSVLEKVARIPINEWSYIGYDQRHIGPMAQDFHAQFPLNPDNKSLNDADLHGVALAAIQGLNKKLEETRKENSELKHELAQLKEIVNKLAAHKD